MHHEQLHCNEMVPRTGGQNSRKQPQYTFATYENDRRTWPLQHSNMRQTGLALLFCLCCVQIILAQKKYTRAVDMWSGQRNNSLLHSALSIKLICG
jgi:hypothetical protein